MKQRIICLLAAICLLLAGCGGVSSGGNPSTTQTFPTGQTPAQILTAAAEKTAGASSFVLTCVGEEESTLTVTLTRSGKGYTAFGEHDCGCRWYVSGAARVHLQCQIAQITKEEAHAPYTLQQILDELPGAKAGLWERLSQFSLTAEPLGDGSTRYGVQEMRYVDMCYLLDGLYPPGSNGEDDDFGGYFFATVDASGYLTGIEFKSADLKNPIDYSIKLEKLNQKLTIETPWWAEE